MSKETKPAAKPSGPITSIHSQEPQVSQKPVVPSAPAKPEPANPKGK